MRRFSLLRFHVLQLPVASRKLFTASLIWSFFLLVVLSVLIWRLQPQVPLFYSRVRPEEHLASKWWLYLLPGLSLLITCLHFVLLTAMPHLDKLLAQLFSWSTLLLQILFSLAFIRILYIIL